MSLSPEFSRTVLQALPDGYACLRLEYNDAGVSDIVCIDANPAFLAMIRMTAAEVLDQRLSGIDRVSMLAHRQYYPLMEQVDRDGQTRMVEFPLSSSGPWYRVRLSRIDDGLLAMVLHSDSARVHQSRVLQGIAEAARILLTTDDFDEAIVSALREIGLVSNADRIHIFELRLNDATGLQHFRQRYNWAKAVVSLHSGDPELIDAPIRGPMGQWYRVLAGGASLNRLVRDMSAEEQEFLQPRAVLAMLAMPIFTRDTFWGFIGFDNCHSEERFTASDEAFLSAAAHYIGGALERQRYTMELIAAKERAEESDKLKSSLLSNMSHEIRTPLNGILGFGNILTQELSDPTYAQMSACIVQSGNRLLHTLNAILELAQLESAAVDISISILPISRIITEIARPYETMARSKGLTFGINIDDMSIMVAVDMQLLTLALRHVLDNAIKFTDTGGIILEATHIPHDNRTRAAIHVHDTGIGIRAKDLPRIFEPFRQGSEGLGRHYEGAGLGLSLAHRALGLMDAELQVVSEPGRGSTFTIVLEPVDNDAAIVSSSPESTVREVLPPLDHLVMNLGHRPEVLVVEDNILNANLAKTMLERVCWVDVASTGEEAISKATSNSYDLILMDINLGPGMDGIEATAGIRAIDGYADTPIAALTGYTLRRERDRFMTSGLTHYLGKPFAQDELLKLIREMLHRP